MKATYHEDVVITATYKLAAADIIDLIRLAKGPLRGDYEVYFEGPTLTEYDLGGPDYPVTDDHSVVVKIRAKSPAKSEFEKSFEEAETEEITTC